MSENLRPARHACERTGVLEFHVWEASPGGDTVLTIIGPHTWRRPITGENRDGELIVKSEDRFNGVAATVSDYLAAVFGELSGYVATHSARYFSDEGDRSARHPGFVSASITGKLTRVRAGVEAGWRSLRVRGLWCNSFRAVPPIDGRRESGRSGCDFAFGISSIRAVRATRSISSGHRP